MEGVDWERVEKFPLFCENIKEAQSEAMENRWKDFKETMMKHQEIILKPFDLFENTAIHVATGSNNPRLLQELIQLVPEAERWQALCKKNREGNTVLHEIVFSKNVTHMADVVFSFEDELHPPEMEEKRPLLELTNVRGETPLFMAAMHGKLKILKHMANRAVTHHMDLRKHWHRSDEYNVLHVSVIGQHLHVAIWLVRMDEELALEKDKKNLTCLQLLSKMPHVFRSHTQMGAFEGIDHMWKEKKKHKLADSLANILIEKDLSWQASFNENRRTKVINMPRHPLNVVKRRRISAQNREERRMYDKDPPERTALFIATKTGIVEIVEKYIELHPAAIYHVTENKQNILNMAAKYRQKKILEILQRTGTIETLAAQLTDKERTILHEVARMDYYKGEHLAGVAFRLQDELRWYDVSG
ncbi:unnamed protein product [Sphenostylis stenocarpa]|uniref:Uncharacterized protein n=1 Tax=Sphenostylis stenocarpa TaxID=92480 RepID=A0AA86T2M4_9FABA|nr:unnamed protein product [Sphenostylis stenocarpa]